MGALPQDLEKKMSGLLCRGTGDTHLPWGTKPSCPGPTRRECHLAAARKNCFLYRDLSGCLCPGCLHTIFAFATAHQSRLSHPSCCGSCCRLSPGGTVQGSSKAEMRLGGNRENEVGQARPGPPSRRASPQRPSSPQEVWPRSGHTAPPPPPVRRAGPAVQPPTWLASRGL